VDLLITDVVMPEMNGRELREKCLQDPELQKPRILFTSGYTDEIRIQPENPGGFLAKPYTITQLTERVRKLLAQA